MQQRHECLISANYDLQLDINFSSTFTILASISSLLISSNLYNMFWSFLNCKKLWLRDDENSLQIIFYSEFKLQRESENKLQYIRQTITWKIWFLWITSTFINERVIECATTLYVLITFELLSITRVIRWILRISPSAKHTNLIILHHNPDRMSNLPYSFD